jgi:hypothetical protein
MQMLRKTFDQFKEEWVPWGHVDSSYSSKGQSSDQGPKKGKDTSLFAFLKGGSTIKKKGP